MLRKNAKMQLLESVPLFSHCTKKELELVAGVADEIDLPIGRELAHEGDRGREFCVIIEGAAEVSRNGETVNTLGPGDFVGEIALLTGGPRTATVTTTEPTHALVLTEQAFHRVADEVPSVQWSVVQALAERLHNDAL